MKQTDEVYLFGEKDDFAIQIGFNTDIEKSKLCFWIEGKKIGAFSKRDTLKDTVSAYEKFSFNSETYYESVFDSMNNEGIKKYFIDDMFALANSSNKEKHKEFERRSRYPMSWGQQITNDGTFIKILYKEGRVILLHNSASAKATHRYTTSFITFTNVFNQFVSFYKEKKLI